MGRMICVHMHFVKHGAWLSDDGELVTGNWLSLHQPYDPAVA
jgi:hypothetical protein